MECSSLEEEFDAAGNRVFFLRSSWESSQGIDDKGRAVQTSILAVAPGRLSLVQETDWAVHVSADPRLH